MSQIKGWLKQGIAEFGLVIQSPHVAEYQQINLYHGKFCLYKHKKEKRQLKNLGVCVEHKEGLMVSEFQASYMSLHKEEMPISSELNSWEFIARSMENGQGYGLIPDLITLKGRYSYLLPLSEPTLPYTLCAVYLKSEELSYSAKTFLKDIKNFL